MDLKKSTNPGLKFKFKFKFKKLDKALKLRPRIIQRMDRFKEQFFKPFEFG